MKHGYKRIRSKKELINPDVYNVSEQKPFIMIFPDTSIAVIEVGLVSIRNLEQWDTGQIEKMNITVYDPGGTIFKSGGYKRYRQYKEKERRRKVKQKGADI